ncbi:hypothetical protein ABVT39_005277 [Epinephelus coioides]
MDRLQFSRNVLQTILGFSAMQLDYIFAFPGRKVFEVIFATFTYFEQCIERFNLKKPNTPGLEKITLIPLSERDARAVTVIMYSEKISTEDIQTWLSFHCTVVLRGMELRDQDGIRTGACRFYVRLRRESEIGPLHHLPSTIQLGPVRGHVFYQGQPKDCRKCGSLNHLAANCNATFCKNCKVSTHSTRNCDQPMRCNLCGASTHSFRSCPESYANRARHQDPYQTTEPSAEEQPAPEGKNSRPDGQGEESAPDAQPEGSMGAQQMVLTSVVQPEVPITHNEQAEQGESLDGSADPVDIPQDEGKDSISQEPTESQGDLPAAQQTASGNPTIITAKDCRDLLEVMMGDLPPPIEEAPNTSELRQPLEVAEELPQSLPLFSDSPSSGQTSSQKRQKETSGDDSSPSQQTQENP